MKRFLYSILIATLLSGCYSSELCLPDTVSPDSSMPEQGGSRVVTLDNGQIGVYFDLTAVDADVVSTTTRVSDPEMALGSGWGLVFGPDPSGDESGNGAPLLQKTTITINANNMVFFTFDPQSKEAGPYYFRFLVNLTNDTTQQVDTFVSQKMIDENPDSYNAADVSCYGDYKLLSEGLDAFYNIDDDNHADIPNPNTSAEGHEGHIQPYFPMSSPGTVVDEITQESLESLIIDEGYVIQLVRVGSKVDVFNKASNFSLSGVTLHNGARRARMRNTILSGNGSIVFHTMPLPINLGGVVTFTEVEADGAKTKSPIYFFPNEGDPVLKEDGTVDVSEVLEPENEDWENLSDPLTMTNPTYLILRGTYNGVENRYYKVPIKYIDNLVGSDSYGFETYDIMRNHYYKLNVLSVDNPGYKSYEAAVDGVASDISYSIEIDSDSDNRNEFIVSSTGAYYLELNAASVYLNTGEVTGGKVSADLQFAIHKNSVDTGVDLPELTVTGSGGVKVTSSHSAVDGVLQTIEFTASEDGAITIECGNILQVVPVFCDNTYAPSTGGVLGFGYRVGDFAGIYSAGGNLAAMFTNKGVVKANQNFKDRSFDGLIYPDDMSKGAIRAKYYQAANFMLKDQETDAEIDNTLKIMFASDGTIKSATGGGGDLTLREQGFEIMGYSDLTQRSVADDKGDMKKAFNYSINNGVFSIKGNNIGENRESNKKSITTSSGVYSYLDAKLNVSLKNIAGETKTYLITAEQYARPYFSDENDDKITVDPDTGEGIWFEPDVLVADCEATLWWGHNRGSVLSKTTVKNCHYDGSLGEYSADNTKGRYYFEEINKGDVGYDANFTGGADGVKKIKEAFIPQAYSKNNPDQNYRDDSLAENEWRFEIKVSDKSVSGKYQAYFVFIINNLGGDECMLKVVLHHDGDFV